jgi:threonine synthase
MRYLSTRGSSHGTPGGGGDTRAKPFCDILLEGLSSDGGLFVPQTIPQVDRATLAAWRHLSYADLAFEVFSLYIDDIPPTDLKRLCHAVYTAKVFGSAAITPLKPLSPGLALQALSNGPTLAFKDVAMQMLGALFEYQLARTGQRLNILGATSGDTGSAAEYAMKGKQGIRVFMLSPHGRMSAFQQAQMFSVQDANIHNLTVDGVFDDCQDIVKAVGQDTAFKQRHAIGTVNSINWARLLAQIVYYVAGWIQATTRDDQRVSFVVPSGNFGNVCAGHFARRMGVPIDRLICATNENDVLDEFFRTGCYRPRTSHQTQETSSPSMDISKASNFERFIHDVVGRDGAATRALFNVALQTQGAFTLDAVAMDRVKAFGFASGRSTHADRVRVIRDVHAKHGVVVDPHTADGVNVAWQQQREGETMLVLETALPAKFASTIHEALGREPDRPAGFDGLESLPRRFTRIRNDAQAVRRYIEANV